MRVGSHHRALAVETNDGLVWFWIGTHADYDRLDHHMSEPTDHPRDRYRGALRGLAAGDALGTTLEFRPPGTFTPITTSSAAVRSG